MSFTRVDAEGAGQPDNSLLCWVFFTRVDAKGAGQPDTNRLFRVFFTRESVRGMYEYLNNIQAKLRVSMPKELVQLTTLYRAALNINKKGEQQ